MNFWKVFIFFSLAGILSGCGDLSGDIVSLVEQKPGTWSAKITTPTVVTVMEGDGVNFLPGLSQPAETDAEFKWSISPADSRFLASSGSGKILAGDQTFSFLVKTVNDSVYQGNTSYTLKITGSNFENEPSIRIDVVDDETNIGLSLANSSVSESAGNLTLTFTLSKAAAQDVTFRYDTANGTAVAGSDYTALSGTASIPAGQTQVTKTLVILPDTLNEVDETLAVNISSASSNVTVLTPSASMTILDDDPAPSLTIADASANENVGTLDFTVSLSQVSGKDVSVNYATSGVTALLGGDFASSFGTLTIPAGQLTAMVPVTILDDVIYEGSETFAVDLSFPSNASIIDSQGIGTIIDNDSAPQISISNSSANEDSGQIVFTVTKTGVTALPLTVDFATANGTATSGSDYTATSGTLTIAAGSTTGTITVPVSTDSTYEGDENVTVTLSNPTQASITSATATGTITNDDSAPTISIAATWVNEDSGPMVFTVTKTGATSFPITVDYASSNGTAAAGSDYTATSGTLTIPAGSTTGTISVPITADAVTEPGETLTMTLTNPTGATLSTAAATGTIINDDGVPSVAIASNAALENSGSLVFTITKTGASTTDLTVDYTTSNGTATAGSDFTATSGTLTITAGATTGTITVPLTADTNYENDETFLLTLSNPTDCFITTSAATGTITNDDPVPSLAVADVSVNEDSGPLIFTVTRTGNTNLPITVDYATSNVTAAAGSDYTSTSGTLTIPSGSTTGTISVPISADSVFEGNETFTITLSNPTGATISTAAATGTITNDDSAPAVAIANNSVNEDSGPLVFTVTKTGSTVFSLTIDYATSDGTASAGSDYTSTSGTLTIPAGSSTGTISVPISADSFYENNETFTMTLSNPTNSTISTAAATGTITNDETAPSVAIANNSVNEDSGPLVFTVTKTGSTALAMTVDYTTSNGTASSGSDYTTTSGTLTIAAGSTTGTISVPISSDSSYENNETFTLTLSNPTNGTISTAAATGTITNDDSVPSVAIANNSVNEDAGPLVFTVTKTGSTGLPLTVDYVTSNGTATAGSDYTSTSGTLTIAAGSTTGTISVPISTDTAAEGDETFTVTISNPTATTISTATATGTITNDDAPTISTISPTDGPDAVATTITISGTGFLTGATATVGGATCTSPNVVSSTSFTCSAPAGTAGAQNVVLTNTAGSQPSGTRSVTSTGGFTYVASTWNFGTAGDFTYNATLFTTSQAQNKATLVPPDLTSNTQAEFDAGTHVGTTYDNANNKLTLNPTMRPIRELASSWTPKWSNIIAYWPLNSDANDGSGVGNHLVLNGDAALVASSALGAKSLGLDGTGDYGKVASFTSKPTTQMSVTAWIYLTQYSQSADIVANWGTAVKGVAILGTYVNDHDLRFVISQTDNTSVTVRQGISNPLPLNTWIFVAGTADGSYLHLYRDGQEVAAPVAYNGTLNSTTLACMVVGYKLQDDCSTLDNTNGHWFGDIDELAIWNTGLTATEVKYIYESQAGKMSQSELDSSWTPQWNSLSGYWRMNGDWKDATANANDLSAAGNATFTSSSQLGSYAGSFDGTGDYVAKTSPANLDLTEFTISAWINAGNSANYQGIAIKSASTSDRNFWFGLQTNGKLWLKSSSGGVADVCIASGDTDLRLQGWVHVVGTLSSSECAVYVNGAKQGFDNSPGTPQGIGASLNIGRDPGATGREFIGSMDEVAIWSKALTTQEVDQVFARQVSRFAGFYVSPVETIPVSKTWSSAKWSSTLPFRKELPGDTDSDGTPNGDSTSDYSALSPSGENLSVGLEGLWHFNEATLDTGPSSTDFLDSSGKGRHIKTTSTGAGFTLNEAGLFNKSVYSAAASENLVTNAGFDLGNLTEISVGGWVKNVNASLTTKQGLFYKLNPVFEIYAGADGSIDVYLKNDGGWHRAMQWHLPCRLLQLQQFDLLERLDR